MRVSRDVMVAVSLGIVVAVLAGERPRAAPLIYTLVVDEVRNLGTLSGHVSSVAHAVSEWGAIAGSSEALTGRSRRAVFWGSPDSTPVSLGHLGGGWSEAWGINNYSVVVGNSRATTNGEDRAFKWTLNQHHTCVRVHPESQMKTLRGLCAWGPWSSDSEAYAVNNSGWVVGRSRTCGGDYHATLWRVRIVVLGAIDGIP